MVLEQLRTHDGFVSGEELCRQCGISRQALWKQVQELRERGYEIESVPHLGYRLASAPDRLYPEELLAGLGTKAVGRCIHYFEKTASTMDEAMRLGPAAAEGTLVVAESQQRGRGRLGRSWSSPGHKGIYASLILKPDILPNQAPVLALMASVSICGGIEEACGVRCGIKWPNDIILDGEKLGGILTELKAELDTVRFVVIGFGINVNSGAEALVKGAASLQRKTGEPVCRPALLRAVLRHIEKDYHTFRSKGPAPLLEQWKALSVTLGRKVRVECHHDRVEGEAVELDADGGLLVRRDTGVVQKFFAGDIVHLR